MERESIVSRMKDTRFQTRTTRAEALHLARVMETPDSNCQSSLNSSLVFACTPSICGLGAVFTGGFSVLTHEKLS